MFQTKTIKEKFAGLVGWEQDIDPKYKIADALTKSESGIYYQEEHPLVTLQNIRACAPDFSNLSYPDWNRDASYTEGQKTYLKCEIWKAVRDNIRAEPGVSDAWEKTDNFSEWLDKETKGAIGRVMHRFTTEKMIAGEGKNLLERRAIFDGAGRLADLIDNSGRIVGYEITPVRGQGVTAKIERIGFQMSGEPGSITLYLFHSSRSMPIKMQKFDFVTQATFQWFDIQDWFLPYMNDETNAGGSWYICYDQSELPANVHAVNIAKDWTTGVNGCGTCNKGNTQWWQMLSQNLQVAPFRTERPSAWDVEPSLWDVSRMFTGDKKSYGLNLEVTVMCDITDFLVQERRSFANVVSKAVAAHFLRLMALNPNTRVNINQVNVERHEVLYEVDGGQNKPSGIKYELDKAMKAIEIDTSGIDRICLPCNNGGVRYRTI